MRATRLAGELAQLVRDHSTLREACFELYFPPEKAARMRLRRGVAFSEYRFSEEVENRLDELQERDFPDFKSMTTSEAYRVVEYMYNDDRAFADRLTLFSRRASETADLAPITPYPGAENVDQHILADMFCGTLDYYMGSPCIEICAALVSTICDDANLDNETVKKWWQRRRDS
jgi:hypothetical protein